MRFDDRLTTVLAQPAEDAHDRAVRWRQLVELLARGRGSLDTDAARQALAEVRAHSESIPERLRAAASRAISGINLPVELVALFAADSIAVAAPILSAATLSDEDWRRVYGEASAEVRAFVATLQPGIGDAPIAPVPSAPGPEPARPQPEPSFTAAPETMPSISDLVARIERLRRTRTASDSGSQQERGDTGSGMFRWEALPSGEISWVDGAPRGAVVGRSLAAGSEDGFDPRVERAFDLRAPFREAPLMLAREGRLAGEWRVSGVPAFEPSDGRFAGYSGIAVLAAGKRSAAPAQPSNELPDHDSVRELVHEIKTPLNAIMGFAEIIESQYLGPADRRYRSRAGDIIGQARVLLEAIDDLDFAARMQTPGAEPAETADLRGIVTAIEPELTEAARAKGIELRVDPEVSTPCDVNRELGRRLLRRFGLALVDAGTARESFTIMFAQEDGRCIASSEVPGALRSLDGPALFLSDSAAATWLRLLRGLARIAGGDFRSEEGRLILSLPRVHG